MSPLAEPSLALTVPLCRWSLAIIIELGQGPKRFSELKRSLGVSNRVIAYKLKILEKNGIVDHVRFGGSGVYVLTSHGARVAGIFSQLDPLSIKSTEMVHILRCKWMREILSTLWRDSLPPTEIVSRMRGITWKVLSENLKRLENFGLVGREIVATRPVRVRYGLTSRGRQLTGWLLRNGIL